MRAITMMLASHASPFDDSEAGDYQLIEIPSDRVDEEMRIAGASSGIPDTLQGLWWMDGNPLPDEVISFGASTWSAAEQATRIRVYGQRIWSWHGNILGRLLYHMARMSRLVYELHFDPDLTLGTITPNISVLGARFRVPESLLRLTLRRKGDGLWLRESRFFGVFHHVYHLRRIVGGDGARLDTFAAYVESAPARSFLAVRLMAGHGQPEVESRAMRS